MAEQAPQPSRPEQSPRRRKLGFGLGVAAAAAVGVALLAPQAAKDTVDAHPAPTTSSPTPEASTGGESNEAMAAEFDKIKEPALASARSLLEKIPSNAVNTDGRLRISIDSSTAGKYSPDISAEATPETHQITIDARDGEGRPGNSLSYTFKVNDEGIFADRQITSGEFATALSDPTKVEVTDVQVIDFDKNIAVGLHHLGEGPTERFNFDDGTPSEPNTPTFRDANEIAQFNKETIQPAITDSTAYFTTN